MPNGVAVTAMVGGAHHQGQRRTAVPPLCVTTTVHGVVTCCNGAALRPDRWVRVERRRETVP